MTYIRFQLKKAGKDKTTWIAICITLVLIFICLGFNSYNQKTDTLSTTAKSQVTSDLRQMRLLSRNGQKPDPATHHDLVLNQKILHKLNQKKWRQAYQLQISQYQSLINTNNKVGNFGQDAIAYFRSEVNRFQALSHLNIPEQSASSPTTGISFLLYIEQWVTPVLVTLITILICAQLDTKRFKQQLNKDTLLPMSTSQNTILSLGADWLTSSFILLIIMFITFLGATIISGVGISQYPFEVFPYHASYGIYVPQIQVLFSVILLRLLSTFFIVACVFFFALVTRKTLVTLFLSLLLLVGTNLITSMIEPISKIAQYLPTSYFNGVTVTSGWLARTATNQQLTVNHGIIVLLISTIVMGTLTYVEQWWQQRRLV